MAAKTQSIIQLKFDDKESQVRVETDKEDRFILTVQAAILACQAYGHNEEFTKQFRHLQSRLTQWYKDHGTAVANAYLTVRDSAILFLVVQQSAAFSQDLEDSLTDLDLSIAQDEDFNLIRLDVLALPTASEESIESFHSSFTVSACDSVMGGGIRTTLPTFVPSA